MLWIGIGLIVFVALPLVLLSRNDEHKQREMFGGIIFLLALILIFLSAG